MHKNKLVLRGFTIATHNAYIRTLNLGSLFNYLDNLSIKAFLYNNGIPRIAQNILKTTLHSGL